jgi:hypothetical protein
MSVSDEHESPPLNNEGKPNQRDPFRDAALFAASLVDEVLAKADRVRNLIGGVHWPSDGAYRERILREAIRTACPSSVRVGDGFLCTAGGPYVVDKRWLYPGELPFVDDATNELLISRQIDVLIYQDSMFAPLFRDESFAVVPASTALAAVEVKTSWNYGGDELATSVDNVLKAYILREVVRHRTMDEPLFTAVVAFETGVDLLRRKKSTSGRDLAGISPLARCFLT